MNLPQRQALQAPLGSDMAVVCCGPPAFNCAHDTRDGRRKGRPCRLPTPVRPRLRCLDNNAAILSVGVSERLRGRV